MIAAMNALRQAIEKAEAFLVLGIGDEAWETLEDLSTELKNYPPRSRIASGKPRLPPQLADGGNPR